MPKSPDSPPDLAEKSVLLAGVFDNIGRMEARMGLQRLGARVVTKLEPPPDYVVAGVKGGPRLEQALAMGVPHLDEAALLALLRGGQPDGGPPGEQRAEGLLGESQGHLATAHAGTPLPDLNGAVVVIAGRPRCLERPVAKRKLEQLGATVADRLDSTVSHVVVGEGGGPTLFAAKEQGIPLLDEQTLMALVARLPEDEPPEAQGGELDLRGARVAMAGSPTGMGRDRAIRLLERLGATVTGDLDRNVTCVFACEGGASTLFRAKQLGIREVDEATLVELLTGLADEEEPQPSLGQELSPGDLAGKKVLIAGALEKVGRVEARQKLKLLGAELVDEITEDVAFVVAGEGGGRNLFLAREAGLPVLEETRLLTLLARAPAVAQDTQVSTPEPENLAGLRVLLAGRLPGIHRAMARRKLERMGARVLDEVDEGADLVFAGEGGGRNLLLARQRGLDILDARSLGELLARIPEGAPGDDAPAEPPKLRGKTVAISGRLERMSRKEAARLLESLGAEVVESVDDSPDILVTGSGAPRALFIARQQSIPVLPEETLLEILSRSQTLPT